MESVDTKARALIEWLDHFTANASARGLAPFLRPSGFILNIVAHSVVADASEFDSEMDSRLATTVEDLTTLIVDLRKRAFAFIRPSEMLSGNLPAGARYACLTFDDGYANNLRFLPLMEKYEAKATFFVASGNVLSGKSFWWDVMYRQLRRRGWQDARIRNELARVRRLHPAEIQSLLGREFGRDPLYPAGDVDRPLSPRELKALAERGDVDIGNHTRDHACLTACSMDEAMSQIEGCQRDIEEITGSRPCSIAYPYGDFDSAAVHVAGNVGLKVGLTTEQRTVDLRDLRVTHRGDALLRLPRVGVRCRVERALVGSPFASAARWLRHSLT